MTTTALTTALLFCAAPVALVGGQSAPPPLERQAQRPAPFGGLARDRHADGASRYAMRFRPSPDSGFRPVGTMHVVQETERDPASPATAVIRRVITYDYGAGQRVIDTTWSVASTLAPIRERTHKSSGATIFLDFDGRMVTGHLGPDSARRAVRDTLPTPAFNTTDLDLVVRAAPLRAGFSGRLPVYDPEFGGYRFADVRIEGRRDAPAVPHGPTAAWVATARDRRLVSTYYIDGPTRALLGIDVVAGVRGEYEIRRVADSARRRTP